MRKGLIVILAVVLAAAFAAPAAADMKASGFYRTKAWMSNFHDGSGSPNIAKDPPTAAFVEQRFRVKFDFGEENVKAVWFLESDLLYGDSAGSASPGAATRNAGGALGADKVQTETKNIYVWFKVPDTSIDVTAGLQGQGDSYAGLLFAADMAGVFVKGKFEPVSYRLGWAKLYENNTFRTDDMTLYVAEVKFSPTKEVKLGLNFYFIQDDTQKIAAATQLPSNPGAGNENKVRVYSPGIDVAFKAGPLALSGFAIYQMGEVDELAAGSQDTDISGFAVDLRADMNLGPGKAFIEGLYISGSDQSGANPDYESIVTLATREASPGGNSAYSRTGMEILLSSPDTINVSQCLIGCSGGFAGSDPGNGGRGLWHIAAGYSQKFTDKFSGSVNVGYLQATEKLTSDPTFMDEEMGTEFNVRLNYNITKGLDFGLVGAYALIGDFFKPNAADSPDDAYDLIARLNYSF